MSVNTVYRAWQEKASPKQLDPLAPDLTDNLELVTLPTPVSSSLPPKTALVRMKAASLNFRDLLTIGQSPIYPTPLRAGNAPCSDGAGEVVACGPSSEWKVGERMILAPNSWREDPDQRDFEFHSVLGGTTQGSLRELAVVEDNMLIAASKSLSFEENATLSTAGVTAYRALLGEVADQADAIKKGDWVLTQGTGGVSLWAIQIAAAIGAKVIATSSSEDKLKFVKKLGATHVINYKTHSEWHEEVLRLTNGRGVDRVVEVGGSATLVKSLKSTRMGGTVIMIGVLSDGDETGVAAEILFGAKKVIGNLGGSAGVVKRLAAFADKHNIRPVIGDTFKFQDSLDAVKAMQKQNTMGKIVITI